MKSQKYETLNINWLLIYQPLSECRLSTLCIRQFQLLTFPGPTPEEFLRGRNPHPPGKKGCKTSAPGAKIHVRESSKATPPGQNKTEEIN